MSWNKKRLTNLCFLIGVVALVVMLFTFDVSFVELWEHICRAGLWLIPIMGVWIVIYGMNAMSWHCIIRSIISKEERVSLWRIFKLTISGYALNYSTPMGGLGGEPYRIMELSKDIGNQRATSSVVLYVMMHFLAHFMLWFFSIFLYIGLAWHGDVPLTPVIEILLALAAVLCLLAAYLFSRGYKYGLVTKMTALVGKMPGLRKWGTRFMQRHETSLRKVDEQIAMLHQQDKRTFYWSLLLEFAARLTQSFEIMFMLLLFDIGGGSGFSGVVLTFLYSVLMLAVTTVCANLIGFLPMQIGVQEGGFVVSIALLGFAPAVGVFVSIICRVREVFWIFVGLVLMKISRRRPQPVNTVSEG